MLPDFGADAPKEKDEVPAGVDPNADGCVAEVDEEALIPNDDVEPN